MFLAFSGAVTLFQVNHRFELEIESACSSVFPIVASRELQAELSGAVIARGVDSDRW